MRLRFSVLLCLGLIALPPTRAQVILNSGFETPSLASGTFQMLEENPAPAPWEFWGGWVGIANGGEHTPIGGASGQFAFLRLDHPNNTPEFRQTVTFTTAGTFTLSYLEGRSNFNLVSANFDASYHISLIRAADDAAVFSTDDAATYYQSVTLVEYEIEIPTLGDYIFLIKGVTNGQAGDRAITFDNFAFTNAAAVPEPSTYAALTGGAVLLRALWKRRKQRGPDPTPLGME